MNRDLFDGIDSDVHEQRLEAGATLLRHLACPLAPRLLTEIDSVLQTAPLRNMVTPGGARMAVSMSNCGALGWISDRRGYRYVRVDPLNDRPWPAMPAVLRELAAEAANRAGFAGFEPDACLINRYAPGVGLSLHQDRDEQDFDAPIVSVSLGLPAVFLFGGNARSDKPLSVPLGHGDVVVWGGPARRRFHGVRPIREDEHPLTGRYRFNLTLRKAG